MRRRRPGTHAGSPGEHALRFALSWRTVCACLLLGGTAGPLAADEILVGRFWRRNVTIETVQNGKILYTDSVGGEHAEDLPKLKSLKVSAFADLAKAHDAVEKGDDKAAAALLKKLLPRVKRQPWLKHWVQWQRMMALARLGRATESVITYIALARGGADAFYLGRPPTGALVAAGDGEQRDIRKRLTRSMSTMSAEGREGAAAMLEALERPSAAADGADDDKEAPAASDARRGRAPGTGRPAAPRNLRKPRAVGAPGPTTTTRDVGRSTSRRTQAESAVVLPAFIRDDDPVTKLLRDGRFQDALTEADKTLAAAHATRVNVRWYQRGVARLALAERASERELADRLYREAGLDFMRVVVYFPRGRYRSVCLVEAGYVHEKIGRHDKARQLYRLAREGPQAVNAKDDPGYDRRLEQLLQAAEKPPQPAPGPADTAG